MKTSSKIALAALLMVVGVVASFALSRPATSTSAEAPPPPVPVHSYSADTRPTMEVYGDSIAHGDSTNFQGADAGPTSWTHYIGDHGIRFVGGFAQGGHTSEGVRSEDRNIRATFVVYGFGTNDLRTGVSFQNFAANARAFAERQDPKEEFVVIKLGPMDDWPQENVEAWNEQLAALAEEEGWTVVDPWEAMRGDGNTFVEQYTFDGLHPNEAGAEMYGGAVVGKLLGAGKP